MSNVKAVFSREFHWRRPKSGLGFGARASDEPQTFPRDFIDAAVKAGAAEIVSSKAKSSKPATDKPEA